MTVTDDLDYYTTPGRDRDVAHAILAQARHRNATGPISDIQVRHLLAIGYRAGRAVAQDEINGARADVAGAIARLGRDIGPTDSAYEGVRMAYVVALEAAGLVPEEMS
jgi:hypothetical protein